MQLNELCTEAHERAKAAGWWEEGKIKTPLECHMLIVSEVAEASEAVRDKHPAFYVYAKSPDLPGRGQVGAAKCTAQEIEKILQLVPGAKPEGEAVELADAVIRIADWFGRHGWDMEAVIKAKMAYNATRGYRHGNKAA